MAGIGMPALLALAVSGLAVFGFSLPAAPFLGTQRDRRQLFKLADAA